MAIASVDFVSFEKSVGDVFDKTNLHEKIKANKKKIILKPNLIESQKHPITTHPKCIESVIEYIRKYSSQEIIIAEGSGNPKETTSYVFDALGVSGIAQKHSVSLVDLNEEEVVKLTNENALVWKDFYCPKILTDAFIVSIPVLKRHSLATVTLSMKNMIGACVPSKYQEGGHWLKAKTHGAHLHKVIYDINTYIKTDFILLDASIGMAEAHLWGKHCEPAINKLVAGESVYEVDCEGCILLGIDPSSVEHIRLAVNL